MSGGKDRTPKVSIIVPAYNAAKYIGECLDSLLSQSEQGLEIIVVNDGSTDSTAEILDGYTDQIKVITQPNGGVSNARNTGIKAANGEFLLFCDADGTPRSMRGATCRTCGGSYGLHGDSGCHADEPLRTHLMNPYFRDYSDFLSGFFPGKVQKISIDAGGTCPNRDGTLGFGGCVYCNNEAFSPMFSKRILPVSEQLERGKQFFRHKYPHMRYLAYFQSYTSTHTCQDRIMEMFGEALEDDEVAGLIIGTRPDCIPDDLLNKLSEVRRKTHKEIIFELGAETSHDVTLQRINRCCTWDATEEAVRRIAERGFAVGLHLILGLPGESEEMMLETVRKINTLPIATVKFHQLQILRNTPLARNIPEDIISFTPESYAELCATIIRILRKDVAIERFVAQAPPELLISPKWGLKNYQFTNLLLKILAANKD